jgi:dihydropteridine reductase
MLINPPFFHSISITLDTRANRSAMPDADFSSWTPLETLAGKLLAWAEGKDRCANGGLVRVVTAKGETKYEVVA